MNTGIASAVPGSRLRDLWLLALGSAALFLVALGARDLWNPNEPIYGRAVVEMWESGQWLLPTVNDGVFAEKPILYYWLALVASHALGGVDEISLRIPSVLAGIGAVLLTYLLVLPYAGRRRALLAASCLITTYLVWWESRAVQMDILILASILGVLVPLGRMLDHGMPQARAWSLAGLAAGLGFAAKGPVAWVIPGIVFFGNVAWHRVHPRHWIKGLPFGALTAVGLASPWYLLLWASGQGSAVYEVLIHQNFTRFAAGFDHFQPWHYYGKYVLADYLPWSLFVPLAIALPARRPSERRLDSLAWIWLLGTVVFFSLSASKRAPYLLPIAPAVSVLASGVIERLLEGRLSAARSRACLGIGGLLAGIFVVLSAAIVVVRDRIPAEMVGASRYLAAALALAGGLLLLAFWRWRRRLPVAIAAATVLLYLTASLTVLPAANVVKSARLWAERIEGLVGPEDILVSYGFRRWRAGYPYYAGRSIPACETPGELMRAWRQQGRVFLLVEDDAVDKVRAILGDLPPVMEHRFASRVAYLFSNQPSAQTSDGERRIAR